MRKILCGLLLCAVILTGCQSASKNTGTPAPAHNAPPAAYPGPQSVNPADAGQADQSYPAPQNDSSANTDKTGDAYPAPNTSAGSAPVTNQYAPLASDENLERGNAFVEVKDSELIQMESFPVQVKLHLKGSLPNPCCNLRVNPSKPDDQNRVKVEVYSVSEPGKVCTQVLKDFDVEIPLGSFSGGHFTVYINGELLGEFDA
jgi:hypothetical protein